MKPTLVLFIGLAVVVLCLAASFATLEPYYGVVLAKNQRVWESSDPGQPGTRSGLLLLTKALPRTYKLHRTDYDLNLTINAANNLDYPASFQAMIHSKTKLELAADDYVSDACAEFGPVQTFSDWKSFFTDSRALGFLWAPVLICPNSPTEGDRVLAEKVSERPILLKILEPDGSVRNVESFKIEIKPNGWLVYAVTP